MAKIKITIQLTSNTSKYLTKKEWISILDKNIAAQKRAIDYASSITDTILLIDTWSILLGIKEQLERSIVEVNNVQRRDPRIRISQERDRGCKN